MVWGKYGMTLKYKINPNKLKVMRQTLEELKKPVTKQVATNVGNAILQAMKETIAKGYSPIRGYGKFPAYKNPSKYPGNRKPKSPVNLELKGDFLDALEFTLVQVRSGFATKIGYAGSKENKKERGHREGANDQPKRPTIPINGETFSEKITNAFMEIYRERVRQIMRKK
jgi:hypothetical protein